MNCQHCDTSFHQVGREVCCSAYCAYSRSRGRTGACTHETTDARVAGLPTN